MVYNLAGFTYAPHRLELVLSMMRSLRSGCCCMGLCLSWQCLMLSFVCTKEGLLPSMHQQGTEVK